MNRPLTGGLPALDAQPEQARKADKDGPKAPAPLPLILVDTAPAAGQYATRSRATLTGWSARVLPVSVAALGIGAVAMVHFRDPHAEGSYGICPFFGITGFWCPGCGGMRAVNNLTNGHFVDAVSSNVITLPLVFTFFAWVAVWTVRSWQGKPMWVPKISRPTMLVIFSLLAIYSVLRNTPWGTWLAPV